ncbi:HAMP domain-containing sensor histidine kinase [Paenibacillus sp. FJAT-27812]|uniref:HAMP domain-containing sensor histidine kinase n=1 Tax=Paenibacillus sp. FJAT-27812 TaxID=1684143 RepID=UPI0006A7BCC5|nr:HAMP domain-containing histidine kinase [Paenibacillus sp. FJAT-27812]
MKLKNKIMLLTSVLVIFILLAVDLSVYFSFIKIATQNEMNSLQNKAEQMIEKIGPTSLINNEGEQQLRMYLTDDSTIRIINSKSELVAELYNEERMVLPQAQFSERKTALLSEDSERKIIIVRVPIVENAKVIGTFEMIQGMEGLDKSIDILIIILLLTSGGAVLLSFLGGALLAKTIVKPISNSINTMREIESSLSFKKIPLTTHSNDEINQMSETFNRMISRLEGSFIKQQQFVSDASHELNTTLTIVEGYANMLRRWGMKDESIQREAIESIYEESKRMRKMTEQLLLLASSEHDSKLKLETFNLVECCMESASLLSKLHRRAIMIQTNGDDPTIAADYLKIKQLILILLDNALKYSKERIELTITLMSTEIEIRVKDLGIGIPWESLDLIFERFYRVDHARQRATGGTGLGLPIAKTIVMEHNGKIIAESEEGVGTEMIVRLPRNNIKQ